MSTNETKNSSLRTLDGQEMEKDQAQTINVQRLWFVRKLLVSRLRIADCPNDAMLGVVKGMMGETKDKKRLAELNLLGKTLGLIKVMEEKGPTGYALASTDSEVAKKFEAVFAAPDISTPSTLWGTKEKPYIVPDLFVPLMVAEESWIHQKAKRDAREAEKNEEREAKKAEAEKKEREAQAERDRQAAIKIAAVDDLFSLVMDPADVKDMNKKNEEREAEDAKREAERKARIEKAKNFHRKALKGELTALGFKTRSDKWVVSDKDRDILSSRSLIYLFGNSDPEETEIRSAVEGSIFHGKLSDTHISKTDKVLPNWMCAKIVVRLRTADGRLLGQTAEGIVVMFHHEAVTMKVVAQEMGLLKLGDKESELAFWKAHRLQSLEKAVSYQAERQAEYEAKRNGDENPTPTPNPEPTNGNGDKSKTPRQKLQRKSDEDGQNNGRPEAAPPEIELGDGANDDNELETPEAPVPVETVGTTGVTIGDEQPLSHTPFAATLATLSAPTDNK